MGLVAENIALVHQYMEFRFTIGAQMLLQIRNQASVEPLLPCIWKKKSIEDVCSVCSARKTTTIVILE